MKKIFSLALAVLFVVALACVAIAEDKPAEGTDTQGSQIENPAETPAATEGQAVENANQPSESDIQPADTAGQANESNQPEQQQQK